MVVRGKLTAIETIPHWALRTFALALGFATLVGCSGAPSPTAKTHSITLGTSREPLGALVQIAASRGFFAEEGLELTLVEKYPTGKRALDGLLAGEVEITGVSEAPLVFASFERNDLRVLATVGASDDESCILARRDAGIEQPGDLRDKRIGTQRASAVHYFLSLFLLRHGMSANDVDVSFLAAESLPEALADGRIDAFAMREPFASQAIKLLGADNVVLFREPGLYLKTYNLVTIQSVLDDKPAAVAAMLRAILRAEEYAGEYPQRVIDFLAARLGMERSAVSGLWEALDLRVSLGQELLTSLEDEARWAVRSGYVQADAIPNYLDVLELEPLESLQPTAVTVVH
ncbi:MAG: ABC transporter substrate-binding protein [Rhodopirellula sp.]|nr:ABC transporter substrate-binding protein [Rhodopirellula sp.]